MLLRSESRPILDRDLRIRTRRTDPAARVLLLTEVRGRSAGDPGDGEGRLVKLRDR
jgi:hypothetical protein